MKDVLLLGNAADLSRQLKDIELIYIDPPYLTGRTFYSPDKVYSFKDNSCHDLKAVCENAGLMLSKNGVICIHVDHRLQHHVRLWLDESLGENNFINQIIWGYKTGGSTNKRFSRKHDYLIVYHKGKSHTFNPEKEKSYNRGFKQYRFKGVEEFCDETGWYTLVNMKDVWMDIPAVGRTSSERNGYPTQKPELLMERIIKAFSNEGDLVADLFCGSGSFLVSAKKLGRNIIGSDISQQALDLTKERLSEING